MKALKPIIISGKEVMPLIEGGKGISVSDGLSSGAWAKEGAVGTFSGISCDCYDSDGNWLPENFVGKTRRERQKELIEYAVKGGITQALIAHEVSGGNGRIHMNILWEAGGSFQMLTGILEGAKGAIHGVTCGAGMPYKLAELASRYKVYYYPIVSSGRAFRALWKRSYSKFTEFLGGVVYEDPWCAGGHNGLSNSEDPTKPEEPYGRVVELRKTMTECGLKDTPIIVAGGIWFLKEWQDFIDNKEIGPVAFQFGTRPLLTKESPIAETWKQKLLDLKKGDVFLQRFSPTGFYSSAIKNDFLKTLEKRKNNQIAFSEQAEGNFTAPVKIKGGREVYVSSDDSVRIKSYEQQGFSFIHKTPDNTIVFLNKEEDDIFKRDIAECSGCLSGCHFSAWAEGETGTTGKIPDPRSFCIHKTLMRIAHSPDVENNMMFAGHNAYRFAEDPFYNDGFIPTVSELIDRIKTGE